jgi:hypothetical protein
MDAAGPVEVVEDGVGGDARVHSGRRHLAGHEHRDRLRPLQVGVDLDVLDVGRSHALADDAVEIGVAHARDLDRPDIGDEDVALGVDRRLVVDRDRAPEPDRDPVAGHDPVVGRQAIVAFGAERAGEQVAAEGLHARARDLVQRGVGRR